MNNSVFAAVVQIFNFLIARLFRLVPHPRLRAPVLRLFGASVGARTRIGDVHFTNIHSGFSALSIEENCFIGDDVMLDLTGNLIIGARTSISPRAIILTHADPGSALGNRLAQNYPRRVEDTSIGCDVWIGAGAIVLCGVTIGDESVVGAGAVVTNSVPAHETVVGIPARRIK